MNIRLNRLAGWAAILSGMAASVALVTTFLFFAVEVNTGAGRLWGPLSDLSPIVQMAVLLIVAPVLYVLERPVSSRLSLLALMIGMAGMLGVVFLQTFLMLGIIPTAQEIGLFAFAAGLVGVWLIVANFVGRQQRSVPSRLAWLGMVVGVAYALEPVIITVVGETDLRTYTSNPLLVVASAIVFVVGYFGFPVWAIWLGRVLLARKAPDEERQQVGLVPPHIA